MKNDYQIQVKIAGITKIFSLLLIGSFITLSICTMQIAMAQSVTIQGSVVSALDDQPLVGVNVYEQGTISGTVTGYDGSFSLSVSGPDATLIFSFIGYRTKEIQLQGRQYLEVRMAEDMLMLDEVIAVGYGVMRKSDLTGSVHSLRSGDMESGSFNSIDKQLSGRIPGVHVTQVSGQPGSGTTIRIRGVNSIMGNNEPLFVVDGVPYGSSLGYDINPNDIESIEVLKDASATAIFGSRGANGVILITTKRGTPGKPRINFDSYVGVGVLDNKLELLDAGQLAELHRMAIRNGVTQAYDPDMVSGAGTDWQDELYRTAPVQNYQLNVSGGTENTTYLFSVNYLNEDGIVLNSGFRRYALRTNLTTKLSDNLTITGNLYVSNSNFDEPIPGVIGAALEANPIFDVQDETGRYLIYSDPKDMTMNPVASARLLTRDRLRSRILPNVSAEYQIIDGLMLNLSLGANLTNVKSNNFNPKTTLQGLQNNGSASIFHSNQFYWVNNNTITYNTTFRNNHHFSAVVGFTAEKQRVEQFSASSNDFITDALQFHSLQSGANQFANSALFEYQLASFLSRINYNIDNRYLFTFSGRYDGSSRFGAESKWGFFPSAAFAWRIINEGFMQNQTFLDDLKLRLSAGVSGEQAIASYQTLPSLGTTATLFANNTYRIGYLPNRLANPALKWERTEQLNVGLDVAFYQGRITFTADYYNKQTTDLLYYMAIPQTSGYTSILTNIGSVGNKGAEFYLKTINTQGSFRWSTDFNIAFNRNEILDLGKNPDGTDILRIVSPAGATGGYSYLPGHNALIVGSHIGGAYGWVYDGPCRSADEIPAVGLVRPRLGDPKYLDLNGDGVVDVNDRKLISNPNPKFSGGIINSFSYKGLDLSLFLQFVYGNELFNYNHFKLSYLDGINNAFPWALDAWTPENPDSNIPRAGWDNRSRGISTFHVEDASYLRAKNITIGYTLPVDKLQWRLSKLRLYVSVDNAFTITNYSGYNPDVSVYGTNAISSGFDDSVYPLSRTFLFGVNVEF